MQNGSASVDACTYSLSLTTWPCATGAMPPTLGTQRLGPKKLPFSWPEAHTDYHETTVHCESRMLMGTQIKTIIDYSTSGGRGSQWEPNQPHAPHGGLVSHWTQQSSEVGALTFVFWVTPRSLPKVARTELGFEPRLLRFQAPFIPSSIPSVFVFFLWRFLFVCFL